MDEGIRTAVYPYSKLRSILRPEDCRLAVLDESAVFEREFGNALVVPFYGMNGDELLEGRIAVTE